ncbi:MAG TPA: sigma-70 family RNA polymerase sigma factor [Solirubrobacteraceae bacterium]|jgi:RNA polymerase sigma factor (sigma-70 family)|nr:sigma-70 family RNA polymerase sigma factor [Solirubrobacteraceae bacterium]
MAARLSSALLRTQSDPRLVALAAQGSEPAFEALVERYRRPLQAYCRRMLLPAEAAEDVVQQAFLSTWQALGNGTQVHDARAWLYRVTHNAAVNALKRSGYDHDQLDEALHGAGAPEEDLERRIAVRRALAGLAELPEMQREALLRTAVEGHSHEDVARALGLTDSAVRGLVYRARATLRTAATALTPAPVVQWAASAGGSANAPLAERIAELVAGTGTAGAGALLMKGGATLLTAGALAGGAVVAEKEAGDGRADGSPAAARAADRAGNGGGGAAANGSAGGPLSALALDDRSGPGRGGRSTLGLARTDDRDGRSGRGGSGSGLQLATEDGDNSGPGSTSSGPGSAGGGDDSSGSSGSGSDSSGSSGSGSGTSGSDSSGSGSGSGSSSSGSGSDDGDSSGSGTSGSGSDDGDSSGSGTSGSGSDDTDTSGSGSGTSGSGSDDTETSGSGTSGSGSGDDRDAEGSGDLDPSPVTTPDDDF